MLNLHFSPFPVLETRRLLLRQLHPVHAADLFLIRSNEQVATYIDRPRDISQEDSLAFIQKINVGIEEHKWIYWGVFQKENERVTGTICLWNLSEERATAEVGFELHPDFQGKGLMQEALAAVLNYGFEEMELRAVEAYTHRRNRAAIQLLEKNGFEFNHPASEEGVVYQLKR